MSDSQWKMLSAMPGEFSVKVAGGTVAFIESPFRPSGNKGGITFADCVIRFSTKEPLWIMPVSGNPSAEITSSGVTGIIPITADVAGTLTPSDWNAPDNAGPSGSTNGSTTEPEYYYVIPLAGQSNGMAYGEGLPLPDSFDRPDPRIKQLARRSTVTPGGTPCKYNDIIPADHCLHDVQDMSSFNHPKAELTKGQYGTVGQGLHVAKKLLPYIPQNAGILLVPC
ncbi:TPA: sialate O-acetylesterase, partial [Escherichia coli]|nr:sialate O-acetylesterase [Escherichia coli]